jgi:hypothetical protein
MDDSSEINVSLIDDDEFKERLLELRNEHKQRSSFYQTGIAVTLPLLFVATGFALAGAVIGSAAIHASGIVLFFIDYALLAYAEHEYLQNKHEKDGGVEVLLALQASQICTGSCEDGYDES